MATTAPVLIPVEEYLQTSYRPDCDYVDGEVLERNMGELPHGRLQNYFGRFFSAHEEDWQVEAVTETRLQVSEKRFRIPDVMVLSFPHPQERIVVTPPLLCVEILSSEDRMRRVQERVFDYSTMGVPATWVVDPWRGLAYEARPDGVLHGVIDRLTVESSPVSIDVSDIWAEIERLERLAAGRQVQP